MYTSNYCKINGSEHIWYGPPCITCCSYPRACAMIVHDSTEKKTHSPVVLRLYNGLNVDVGVIRLSVEIIRFRSRSVAAV